MKKLLHHRMNQRNLRLLIYVVLGVVCAIQLIFFVFSVQTIFEKDSLDALPKNSVWLVLGTTNQTVDGQKNIFFEARMQAVKDLYDAKKIDCVLLSGDNSSLFYNEPLQMQKALLALGIPPERMYLDYAWLRTRDSILRARDIFWITQFTIISQKFHLQRALYHALAEGMNAVGYSASSPPFHQAPRVYIREFFSRFLSFYDTIVSTESTFSGSKIHIEYNEYLRPIPSKICTPR
jgi:SanA protein